MNARILFCLLALLLLVAAGCGVVDDSTSAPSAAAVPEIRADQEEHRVPGKPQDFFPMEVGTRWVYRIAVGPAKPLRYEVVSWPQRGSSIAYSTRGLIMRTAEEDSQSTYRLELRVKQPAAQQGPLRYPKGVELEVVQDDLGVFEKARRLFLAASDSSRFAVQWVATYDPERTPSAPSGSWGHWGQADGWAIRLAFFGERPGTQISLGENSSDKLLFDGVVSRHPEIKGGPFLHFIRTVEPNERERGKPEYLDSGFVEETWFAPRIGLVRLEQRVDGVRAMVWTLDRHDRSTQEPAAGSAKEGTIRL